MGTTKNSPGCNCCAPCSGICSGVGTRAFRFNFSFATSGTSLRLYFPINYSTAIWNLSTITVNQSYRNFWKVDIPDGIYEACSTTLQNTQRNDSLIEACESERIQTEAINRFQSCVCPSQTSCRVNPFVLTYVETTHNQEHTGQLIAKLRNYVRCIYGTPITYFVMRNTSTGQLIHHLRGSIPFRVMQQGGYEGQIVSTHIRGTCPPGTTMIGDPTWSETENYTIPPSACTFLPESITTFGPVLNISAWQQIDDCESWPEISFNALAVGEIFVFKPFEYYWGNIFTGCNSNPQQGTMCNEMLYGFNPYNTTHKEIVAGQATWNRVV